MKKMLVTGVNQLIMNKKILALVMMVLLLFFQFLQGEIILARSPHDIHPGSHGRVPGDPAVSAQTYDSDGTWTFTVVEQRQNLVSSIFDTVIVGDENILLAGLCRDITPNDAPVLMPGFIAVGTVNGDDITFTDNGDSPLVYTGKVANANHMSGTWVSSDGSKGGTWEGKRDSSAAAKDFDIRGNWLFIWEIPKNGEIYCWLWPFILHGAKETGVFEGFNLITDEIEIIPIGQGDYAVSGDRVTITWGNADESIVHSGKITRDNMMQGTYIHTGGSAGTYTASWAAILLAIPNIPVDTPPFGSFDTPADEGPFSGSIAISGWALANRGMDSVKIYREQGSTLVYLGDAVFVEGARPDVTETYPDYPFSDKAGWGYMLLTNFLPDGGNGTFVLHAIATDLVGNTVTLGTKTIYCDNVNAVKPFGAIDTPDQGGTAAGSNFINWGWALTPQPNYIPTDGSTINVYVDGVNIGHPNYNVYREDIAALFPGYANSNGAAGFFYLDTTAYGNGVHTIQWVAADSAGNTDGIGSRYFTINNTTISTAGAQAAGGIFPYNRISGTGLPISSLNLVKQPLPLELKKSRYTRDGAAPALTSDTGEIHKVTGKELMPLEVSLGDNISGVQGYLLVNRQLRNLPAGSTLDVRTGKFYWSPGAGFRGRYRFVFLIKSADGRQYKKSVEINLESKFKVK
jgi:hypothetical protein